MANSGEHTCMLHAEVDTMPVEIVEGELSITCDLMPFDIPDLELMLALLLMRWHIVHGQLLVAHLMHQAGLAY